MEGIRKIAYVVALEGFELSYIPGIISLKRIFERIDAIGKERNLPYNCSIISME